MAFNAPFPADLINPEKKDRDWLKQVARAISSYSDNNATTVGRFSRVYLDMLGNYMNGWQDEQQYLDWYHNRNTKSSRRDMQNEAQGPGGKDTDLKVLNAQRKGYSNIDSSIVSPMPKIVEAISTYIGQNDYKIQVNHTSLEAKNKKKEKKLRLWFGTRPEFLEMEQMMKAMGGVPMNNNDFIPEDQAELDLVMKALGGNKIIEEIAHEDLIEHTFQISDWETMKDRIIYDLIAYNSACTKDYTDPASGASKARQIPLNNLVMSYIVENNNSYTPFAGHYERMTLQEILPYLELDPEWTDAKSIALAQSMFAFQNDFMQGPGWEYYRQRDPLTDGWRFLSFTTNVLFFEYISTNRKYSKKTGTGGYTDIPYQEGYTLATQNGPIGEVTSVVVNTDIMTIYEGMYLVDCDTLVTGGLSPNIKRKDKRTPMLSYHFWRIGAGKSIVERAIPKLNELQRLMLKSQSVVQAAVPPGTAIDIQFVTGVPTMKNWEIIARYKETGNIIYTISPEVRARMGQSGNPIQELKGGMSDAYDGYIRAIDNCYKWLLELTGLSETFVGSPSSNTEGLGINQMQVQGSSNAISKLYRGLQKIKEETAKGCDLRAVTTMKFDKNIVSYYEGVLGDDKVLALREMDTTLEQLGIYMEAMPQAERKMLLMQQIEKALQGGRNGLPQITTAVAFRLNGMIERGDVKEAEVYLALEEKRAQREFERNKDRAITLQGEQNAALQQGMAEAERQKINLEGSWKLKNVQAQAIADIAVKIIEQNGQLQNDTNFIYLQSLLNNLNNTQNGGTSSGGATV